MQVNNIQSQSTFKATIGPKFLEASESYFLKNGRKAELFQTAMDRMQKMANTDNFVIEYENGIKNGVPFCSLYAVDAAKNVKYRLTTKDCFRKLIDKFAYMNNYEFGLKTGLIKKK